ncbi:MAG: hypothetical protein II852_08955 [Bacteroidales bacterium]|nr:hypothetical protein [Bacteroidales bacterium]
MKICSGTSDFAIKFEVAVQIFTRPRMFNGVEVWPAKEFLARLWKGKVICP